MIAREPSPEFHHEAETEFANRLREFADIYAVIPARTGEPREYGVYAIADDDEEVFDLGEDARLRVTRQTVRNISGVQKRAEITLRKQSSQEIHMQLLADYNDDVYINGERFTPWEHDAFGMFLEWLQAGRLEPDAETSQWHTQNDDVFETFIYPVQGSPDSDLTP